MFAESALKLAAIIKSEARSTLMSDFKGFMRSCKQKTASKILNCNR